MRAFRKIEAKDNAAMAELIRSTLKKCKLDIPGTAYFDEGLDRLSEVYDCPGAGYYVLEDAGGRVVGGIGYAKLDFRKDTAELQKLYLDE
ncbi:MAG: N-acetyltransferase, partial [Lachnospiraceae bacterium]|nr:N-acetyltransferase [Lachnospiraceae bacterium]